MAEVEVQISDLFSILWLFY